VSADLPPLEADVRAFVDAEKSHSPSLSPAVRARIAAGVYTRLVTPGGTSGEGGAPAQARGGLSRIVRAHPITSVVVALCVGASAGALLRPAASPRERVVYVERPATVVSPSAAAAANPAAAASDSAVTPSAAEPATPKPSVESPDTSSAERLVLDAARQALARGDASAAWISIGEHERRFPRGRLIEERDALAVRSLIGLGRVPEARRRAETLRRRFPRSIFLPAVDSALGAAGDTPTEDTGR
jgi:hypothetical protein